MTAVQLNALLPGWETMPEPEARAKCKRLDPSVRKQAFKLYWYLAVQCAPKKTKTPKKKASKATPKEG